MTQHRNGDKGSRLCPIRALAGLVARVAHYDVEGHQWKGVRDRPVNLVILDNHCEATLITSSDIKNHIRAAAFLYGEARLGFAVDRLGTHSIRSGAATAMFLAGMPAETTQLIGRWRSQTFLKYIPAEVQQLTRGVTEGMTTNPNFFTIATRAESSTIESGATHATTTLQPG